jgi:hypothetical protein
MDLFLKNNCMEINREIFSYLIPDIEKIEFRKESPRSSYNSYSNKYDVAFFRNMKIVTNIIDNEIEYINNFYLSRIAKKNGKHRYYLTREIVDCIQVEYNDREIDIFHYDYISKYIGKDLFKALITVIYLH